MFKRTFLRLALDKHTTYYQNMDEGPYCPSSFQKPSTSSKAKGKCSVCFKTRKLHDKDEKVHLHEPKSEPCKGIQETAVPHHRRIQRNSHETRTNLHRPFWGIAYDPRPYSQRQHTGGSDSRRQFSGSTVLTPAATTRPTHAYPEGSQSICSQAAN